MTSVGVVVNREVTWKGCQMRVLVWTSSLLGHKMNKGVIRRRFGKAGISKKLESAGDADID